jgi:hypothetical protein
MHDMGYEPRHERPQVEPEILPPERREDMPPPRRPHMIWFTLNRSGLDGHVAAPGPLFLALVLLAIGLLAGVILMLLLGAVLLWLPIAGMILLVLLVSSLLRRLWSRSGLGRRP